MKKTRLFSKKHFQIALSISMILCLLSCSHQNSVVSKGFIQKRKHVSGWFVKSGKFQHRKNKKVNDDHLQLGHVRTAEQGKENVLKPHVPELLTVVNDSLRSIRSSDGILNKINRVSSESKRSKSRYRRSDVGPEHWSLSSIEKRLRTNRASVQLEKFSAKESRSEVRSVWSRIWKVLLIILILLIGINLVIYFTVFSESVIIVMLVVLIVAPILTFFITYFLLRERNLTKMFLIIAAIATAIVATLLLMVEFVPLYLGLLGAILVGTSFLVCLGISLYYLLTCMVLYVIRGRAK